MLLAALAQAPRDSADASALTYREIHALDHRQLARRLLGEVGERYDEVLVETPMAGLSPTIGFATTPRASDRAGVCQADFILVSLMGGGGETAPSPDSPIRITAVEAGTRFKIIGDTVGGPTEDQARRDTLCAHAGPVLPSFNDLARPFFFAGPVDTSAVFFAARALQQASQEVAAGRLTTLDCQEDYQIRGSCHDVRATMALLPPEQVASVEVSRCDVGSPGQCIDAHYDPPASWPRGLRLLRVRIRTDAAEPDPDKDFHILSVEIHNYTSMP